MPVQSTQGQMLSYGSVFVPVEVARLTLRVHALDGDWAELFNKVVMLCAAALYDSLPVHGVLASMSPAGVLGVDFRTSGGRAHKFSCAFRRCLLCSADY